MDEIFFNGVWRMDWGFGNPNKTAALIAVLMIAVWGLAFFRRWGFWVALILFSGLGVCLVHTFSRGGIVALFAGVIPLLIAAPRPWRRWQITGSVLSIWIIAGASVYLQAHKRYELGIGQEDRSISNRFALWKVVPTMMADAPNGWGTGKAGKAFMEWYQPLNKTEKYRTLVNSHLTWLVEFNWAGRLAYFLGWLAIFVVCFPVKGHRWTIVPFGIWLTFFVAAFFSSVAESPWLWVIPGCALLMILGWRIKMQIWPSWKIWVIPPASAGAATLAVFMLAEQSSIHTSGHGTTIGGKNPRVWVVAAPEILGADYGRTLRGYVGEKQLEAIGLTESLSGLPLRQQMERVIIATDCNTEELHDLAQKLKSPNELVLVNPTAIPGNLNFTPGVITVLTGEFAESSRASSWKEVASVKVIEGVGDFVADWPEKLLRDK